jgi:quinol monooxygenase YgiN
MSTTTSHTDAPLPNIAAHGPYGAIIVMNAFVAPSSATDYLKLSAPIAERFRKEPECLFCELSQNPEDPGHIRIVHGWTKDTEWLRQVSSTFSILHGRLKRREKCTDFDVNATDAYAGSYLYGVHDEGYGYVGETA